MTRKAEQRSQGMRIFKKKNISNLTLVSKSYSCVIFGVWPLKVKLSYILFLNSNIANDIINTEITHDTYAGIDIHVVLMLIS